MAENMEVSYIVLGIYLVLVGGSGVLGAFINWRSLRKQSASGDKPVNEGLVRALAVAVS